MTIAKSVMSCAALIAAAPALASGTSSGGSGDLFWQAGNLPGQVQTPATSGRTRIESGGIGDLAWTAANRIVGVTSTATVAGGGDPRYFANQPRYHGVTALIMDYGPSVGSFICSGAMIDRMTILTAAHCISDGFGTPGPLTVKAFFNRSPDPDVLPSVSGVSRDVGAIFVEPRYTGFVIDQNDIAVLRLTSGAPSFATIYELSQLNNLTGQNFNVAGYGGRSTIGGNFGTNAGTGRLRQGDNRMEWRVGDADFAGRTYPIFGPQARTEFSYLADFDNGLAANDASCRFANAANFTGLGIAGTAKFCNLGRGANEVGVAGGDSGGPQFDQSGRIMSVTSFGITFGTGFGDIRGGLNSSFGEFSGFVPVYRHREFIASAMAVPEPASWAMLITGFGLVGATLRRRRTAAACGQAA